MTQETRPSKEPTPESATGDPVAPATPVVAIGASAGGLTAFRSILEHLPTDTQLAFVLIPHLDPTHPSILSDILSKATQMPVKEASDGLRVEPNHAYVISPNTIMTISGQTLRLVPRNLQVRTRHECIDHFMVSLAREYREKSIGVVLSGTASDGSAGLEAIKAEGGITFAQNETAEFPDMPRNAIATGCVDFVLSPEGIAKELAKISRHPYVAHPRPAEIARPKTGQAASAREKLFGLLRGATGVDFALYKQSTIERRIARRMAIQKIELLEDYVQFLESHPPEVRTLHDELLINVTSFFRDPQSFDVLKTAVFPALLENREPKDPIRVWVPGCSTGEEAYSIVIALLEFLEEKGSRFDVQLFGTDISDRAVDRARAGRYDEGIKAEVSEDRLRRFFHLSDSGGYRISKGIRDLCVFAKQDVTRDPPFSRLDLLSCRNMLIYLGQDLQRRVIPLFHYALKPGGFLLLGSSESMERYPRHFEILDKKTRVYRKLSGPSSEPPNFDLERMFTHPDGRRGEGKSAAAPVFDVARATDRYLLAHHVPGVIVLNAHDQIVEVRGDTEPYLKVSPGKLSSSVLKMVREDLVVDLDHVVREVKKSGVTARSKGVSFQYQGQNREVEIEVAPLTGTSGGEVFYAVVFAAAPSAGPLQEAPRAVADWTDRDREHVKLKAELAAQREYQQAIVEKLEAVNEELRSASEETLSSNEELQSTNEELETSKEELQSTNEELATLNDELQHKNLELGEVNSDLANVILGSSVALTILDTELKLRRFTPQAEKLLRLQSTDVGRRITDFKAAGDIPDLAALLLGVIDTLVPVEREVQINDGLWYSLRIRPYRDVENRIQGVVLVFGDIDAIKRSLLALEEATALTEGIVETVQVPLVILDGDLRVHRANRSFYTLFQTTGKDVEGQALLEIEDRQWDVPELRAALERIVPLKSHFQGLEIRHTFAKLGPRILMLNARWIALKESARPKILLAMEDVTARVRAEEAIEELNVGLERRVNERTSQLEGARGEMEAFTYSVAHDLRGPLRSMGGFAQVLLDDYADRPMDDEGRDFARRIIDSSRRMDALIQDLLAYSHLTREEAAAVPVDLDALLDAALAGLSAELEAVQAQVTVEKPLPAVRAHWSSLLQAVSNLLTNAMKFVAPGVRPAIRVRAESRGDRARLWVEDNGIGIAKQHQGRVFKVFERLNPTATYPGTGIGLAIVRRAVERVGGAVGVESDAGQGSRFWIELNR